VQKVLQASGLKYTMHSAGTTVGESRQSPWRLKVLHRVRISEADSEGVQEGGWDEVMTVIGKAHAVVHERGVVRVQSSLRVGTRTDKSQTAEDKVKRVQDLLASGK
jgi:uncharacterized protein (TIGR00106 family)